MFAGLVTLDVVHHVDVAPGPDGKVTAERQDVAAGGPATGAAIAFAALGGRATLVTALGTDPLAALVRADLRVDLGAGVEVVDVAGGDRPVPVSAVRVSPAGRSISGPDGAGPPVAVSAAALARLDAAVAAAAVVLVDGHHPALALAVARAARARGMPLLLDLGRPKPVFDDLLPLADVVVASGDHAGRVAELLAAGPAAVAVTAGAGPVRWATATGSGAVDVAAVDAVDTLGAGDVFHGAVSARLARRGLADVVAHWPDVLAAAAAVVAVRVSTAGPHDWRTDPRLAALRP